MFLRSLVRNPSAVGAVAPSSRYLAQAMLADLSLPVDRTVVEFGPGTGPFTEALLPRLADPNLYLGVDRDPDFVQLLKKRFAELNFVHGSAEQAPVYLKQRSLPPVGAIICGLPFASLPDAVQDQVIEAIQTMMSADDDTTFRTFQYVHAYPLSSAVRFRRRMTQIFGPGRRSAVVWRNLPPAFVLSWSSIDRVESAQR